MSSLLLRGGRVHSPFDPDATALAVVDGVVSWIGGEHGIPAAGPVDAVVDLDGALVVPGFVDAHVHTTEAGLAMVGLDLSAARSAAHCLELVRRFAAAHADADIVWGHGWDETGWPERQPPTRAELDEAVGGRPTYLSRVDVHSALVSTALAAAVPGFTGRPGGAGDGPVTRDAHHSVRAAARARLGLDQRLAAQQAFLAHAAAAGIVEVHECGFGDAQGLLDFTSVLALDGPVRVLGYLGVAVTDPAEARQLIADTGAHALGGDLSVDGALGSHTAALTAPYTDDPGTGVRYLDDDDIAEHLFACARAGVQPGFHAIGDDGVSAVAQGLRRAAHRLGPAGTVALAAVTPRIEHAELPDGEAIAAFAATGTVASVQPLFDATWGGPDGMYARRLGAERAARMNPFAALAAAGVALALGSDAPVTPADPWRAVQAAVHHRTDGFGLSPRAALQAHTRGGHRAAGRADRSRGTLVPGAPADLAVVAAGELVTPDVDAAVARWSTDPRSRVPRLPDLRPGAVLPRPLATLRGGRVVFDTGLFAGVDPGH